MWLARPRHPWARSVDRFEQRRKTKLIRFWLLLMTEELALPWRGMLALIVLVLVAALAVIAALALGWNDPRPARPPDWMATGTPRQLRAISNETTVALLGQSGSDFTFEVVARPIAGPDSGFYSYGLIYRAQDADHYYAFAVGGDGYYAVLRVEGQQETVLIPWQQFPHIRRGQQANRLRVRCADVTCRFTINDEHAVTIEDAAWLSGPVGLWTRGYDADVQVAFEQVQGWRW